MINGRASSSSCSCNGSSSGSGSGSSSSSLAPVGDVDFSMFDRVCCGGGGTMKEESERKLVNELCLPVQ